MRKSFIGLTFVCAAMLFSSQSVMGFSADDEVQFFLEEVETPESVQKKIDNYNAFLTQSTAFVSQNDDEEYDEGLDEGDQAKPEMSDDEFEELLGKIVNVAKKAWEMIAANKPVLNQKFDYANALPSLVDNAYELQGFSALKNRSYRLYAKNFFGATVYDITYTAVHRFGGSYESKGKFLSTVSVIPSDISVLWGYTVNIDVEQVSLANMGSKSEPVASIGLQVTSHIKTIVKESFHRQVFEFQGNNEVAEAVKL